MTSESLRLRLREPEVKKFASTGEITETVFLGGDRSLSFSLLANDQDEMSVTQERCSVSVLVPRAVVTEWTQSSLVGIEKKIVFGNGANLNVLIEKDFKCLDRPDEENEGAYPHPNEVCKMV